MMDVQNSHGSGTSQNHLKWRQCHSLNACLHIVDVQIIIFQSREFASTFYTPFSAETGPFFTRSVACSTHRLFFSSSSRKPSHPFNRPPIRLEQRPNQVSSIVESSPSSFTNTKISQIVRVNSKVSISIFVFNISFNK